MPSGFSATIGAHRSAGVRILEAIGSEAALDALQARFDEETDQEVRDAILRILDRTRPESFAAMIRDRLASAMARAADRLKKPQAKWADEAELPPLQTAGRTARGCRDADYLIHRQARGREITPTPRPGRSMTGSTPPRGPISPWRSWSDTSRPAAIRTTSGP